MVTAASGTVLGGRYQLDDRIAGGGMGEVWTATDRVLQRRVAVKIIRPGLSEEAGFAERFRHEALVSARLAHGNIAQVYDFGDDTGTAYLVMEHVPGTSLAAIIDQRGALPPDEAVRLLAQASDALEAAHETGVVHRDVKPANILVTPRGTVKLTDFGIARAVGESGVTRTGEVMGTAQYLAPEAALGRGSSPQSDVYALAVVTYEVLTGGRPFVADSAVTLAMKHINEPPPPLPPHVPWTLGQVVQRGLAKDPAGRPQGAESFGRQLRESLSDPGAVSGAGIRHGSGHFNGPRSQPQPEPQLRSGGPGGYAPTSAPYGPPSPSYGVPAPGWGGVAHAGPRPPVSRGALRVGWGWVATAALTCLCLLLPFATLEGKGWNAFALTGAEDTYDPGHSASAFGVILLILSLGLLALGLPQALGRPHISLPIVASLVCLLAALMWMACLGTVTGGDEDDSRLTLGAGVWLTGILGTCLLGFVIAAMVKRR